MVSFMKNGILKKNAGKRRTFHPKRPSNRGNSLVRRCHLFYLYCNANPAAKFATAKPFGGSQPFSHLDTIDDSYPSDDRFDGIFHCRMG